MCFNLKKKTCLELKKEKYLIKKKVCRKRKNVCRLRTKMCRIRNQSAVSTVIGRHRMIEQFECFQAC